VCSILAHYLAFLDLLAGSALEFIITSSYRAPPATSVGGAGKNSSEARRDE
jgi:hypothetical protein